VTVLAPPSTGIPSDQVDRLMDAARTNREMRRVAPRVGLKALAPIEE